MRRPLTSHNQFNSCSIVNYSNFLKKQISSKNNYKYIKDATIYSQAASKEKEICDKQRKSEKGPYNILLFSFIGQDKILNSGSH